VCRRSHPTHIKADVTHVRPVDLTRPWDVNRGTRKGRLPNGRIDRGRCEEKQQLVKRADGGRIPVPGEKGYKDTNALAAPRIDHFPTKWTRFVEENGPKFKVL